MRTVNMGGQELEVRTFNDSANPNKDVLQLDDSDRFNKVVTDTNVKPVRICEISSARVRTWDVPPWVADAFSDHKTFNRRATLSGFLNDLVKNLKFYGFKSEAAKIKLISDKPNE